MVALHFSPGSLDVGFYKAYFYSHFSSTLPIHPKGMSARNNSFIPSTEQYDQYNYCNGKEIKKEWDIRAGICDLTVLLTGNWVPVKIFSPNKLQIS